MDAYLYRFERFADSQTCKTEDRASYLSALLKGKALDVYSRLPPEHAGDYDALKKALIRRYDLTEDEFKKKIRLSKPETNESPRQFITRIDTCLQRWVELADAEHTYEGLKALMVQEQYNNICPRDLALFLKERFP